MALLGAELCSPQNSHVEVQVHMLKYLSMWLYLERVFKEVAKLKWGH